MSHFTVAVFTTSKEQSVDDLLAPYDENIVVKPYVSSTKAELIQAERDFTQKMFDGPYAKWKKDPKVYEAGCKNPNHITYLKTIPNLMKRTDEEIYRETIKGQEDKLTKDGDMLSTYNPKSKWDWWVIGGRWEGSLITEAKKGSPTGITPKLSKPNSCDFALVRDIDFEAMRQREISDLIPYEKAIQDPFFKEEYMRDKFPTEEEYIERETSFSTYAVVTPDGVWHEPGRMGWWGISSATPEDERKWELEYGERFIKPAFNNNWYVTIVDCHI